MEQELLKPSQAPEFTLQGSCCSCHPILHILSYMLCPATISVKNIVWIVFTPCDVQLQFLCRNIVWIVFTPCDVQLQFLCRNIVWIVSHWFLVDHVWFVLFCIYWCILMSITRCSCCLTVTTLVLLMEEELLTLWEPSSSPPVFWWGSCCSIFSFQCVHHCLFFCPFSSCHCIVCPLNPASDYPSSIFNFSYVIGLCGTLGIFEP